MATPTRRLSASRRRIVLISGFESFNVKLYKKAARNLAKRCPGVELAVFSDRDIESRREEVAAALDGAEVFFGSLLFDFDQVEWLRDAVEKIPTRFVFESALELMSTTSVGSFEMKPAPDGQKAGPPPAVKAILAKFGSGKEEDKLVGYLSFLKIGPALLRFVPGRKAKDLRNWLTVYGYWNQGGRENVEEAFAYVAQQYLGVGAPETSGFAAAVGDFVARPKPPKETPALGCYHPDIEAAGEPWPTSVGAYLEWYERERVGVVPSDAPTVAVLLYRKHVITQQPYLAELVRGMEESGVKPVPIFINGVEAHTIVRDLLTTEHEQRRRAAGFAEVDSLKPDAAVVDAVVSTVGFPLVGGPAGSMEAGRQAEVAQAILRAKNVPYVVAAPLLIQDIDSWTESGIGGLQSVILYALPELDGAVDTVPLGGLVKDDIYLTKERVYALAERLSKWVALRRKKPEERRVAVMLYGFPPGVGATGTAALLNVPRSLERTLETLRDEGYDLGPGPLPSGEALVDALRALEDGAVIAGGWNARRARWKISSEKKSTRGAIPTRWPGWRSRARTSPRRVSNAGWNFPRSGDPQSGVRCRSFPNTTFWSVAWSRRGARLSRTTASPPSPARVPSSRVYAWVTSSSASSPRSAWRAIPCVCFSSAISPRTRSTPRITSGCRRATARTPSCTWACTARWNGFRARPSATTASAGPISSSAPCPTCTCTPRTTPPSPSSRSAAGTAPSSATTSRRTVARDSTGKPPNSARSSRNTARTPSPTSKPSADPCSTSSPPRASTRIVRLSTPPRALPRASPPRRWKPAKSSSTPRRLKRTPAICTPTSACWRTDCSARGYTPWARNPPTRPPRSTWGRISARDCPRRRWRRWRRCARGRISTTCARRSSDRSPPPTPPIPTPPILLAEAVEIRALLRRNTEELTGAIKALGGEYVPPAVGGDLLRDGPGVLPTGRNIHALDPYRMPSPAAADRGARVARAILEQHAAANDGSYPECVSVNLWGLDAIKTKGESVGIVLELVGARPVKEGTGRVVRYELVPLEEMGGRPRIDALCNMSGIFRDSFANVVGLLDDLFQRAADADEPPELNFVRKHALEMRAEGVDNAGARLFSNPPGDYGSMVNERVGTSEWEDGRELGDTWASRNAFSYGKGNERGTARPEVLQALLRSTERVVQEVDSVEYGLTDIQEYYANTGALVAAANAAKEEAAIGDGSGPPTAFKPVACSIVETFGEDVTPRDLDETLRLEYRTKLLNPRWAEAMADQGSGGAYEISQRMTALIGWGATSGFAEDWVYDGAHERYVADEAMREKLRRSNPQAFRNVLRRMLEAAGRGMWNADDKTLAQLRALYSETEDELEGVRTRP